MRYVFYINPVAGNGTEQDDIVRSIKQYFKDKIEDLKEQLINIYSHKE